MEMKSLWCDMPDIDQIKTPNAILAEQAEALKEMTNSRLTCEVKRTQKNTMFSYEFSIVVPALGNYSQKIMRVTHDIAIYPAKMSHEQSGAEHTANNEGEFMAHLGTILASEETRLIIAGLIAQLRLNEEE